MAKFEKHVFVCINQRPEGHPKGCCADKGSQALRDLFKKELAARGLKGKMRANTAGCLDQCEHGVSVVIYPESVWYSIKTPEDVLEIVERHLVKGQIVERLLMPT